MKLNHLIYTLMLGTALGTSSCSWLDLEPATAVSPSILGQGEVEQLLTGTYRSLQNDPGRDTWVLFDMRGENLINTYLSGSNDFVNNEIPSNNGTLLTMWRGYYKAIYNANPKFKLSENYDNIFTTTNNSEIIFSFRNNTSEGGQNLYALFTTYNSPMKGSWFLCPSPESEKLFEDPADTRNNTCITTLESVSETYIIMNKFRDFTPLIVSRIAEMYLISAEAQGRNGLNRLNELRRSRGLNPYNNSDIASEEDYQKKVALERRKELYCEGFLFFDLIRTNKISEEVVSMNGKTNLYLPLPESEVQYNPNLNEYN